MPNFLSTLIRFIVKVMLTMLGAVFAVSLFVAAMLLLVFSSFKWLVTGKKPAPFVIFSQFNKFRSGGGWARNAKTQATADVVDVEAREVDAEPQQIKSRCLPP